MRKSIRFLLISIICLLAFASTGSNQGPLKGFQVIIGVKGITTFTKFETLASRTVKTASCLEKLAIAGLTQQNSVLAQALIKTPAFEKHGTEISSRELITSISGKTLESREWAILQEELGAQKLLKSEPGSKNKQAVIAFVPDADVPEKLSVEQIHQILHCRNSLEQMVEILDSRPLEEKSVILNISSPSKGEKEAFFVAPDGHIQELEASKAMELYDLIAKRTVQAEGPLPQKTSSAWESFVQPFLLEKETFEFPDKIKVENKYPFIFRSDVVNHKSLKLAEVPVLRDNFIPYIDIEPARPFAAYVDKIRSIPKITKDSIGIVIRHPADLPKPQARQWAEKVESLRKLVGAENVLFDPSKKEFQQFLNNAPNRGKGMIIIELTHTQNAILLKDGIYTSRDVQECGDLSGINYLLTGIGSCNFPLLEGGALVDAFRKKGVGFINATAREVPCEIALKRIGELIYILENIERYDIQADQLLDVIDQRLKLRKSGSGNIGKLPGCGDTETLTT